MIYKCSNLYGWETNKATSKDDTSIIALITKNIRTSLKVPFDDITPFGVPFVALF